MRLRTLLIAFLVIEFGTAWTRAEGLLEGFATNPVLQGAGSPVTSQVPTNLGVNTLNGPTTPVQPPVPVPPPVSANPPPDPFHSAPAAATAPAAPVVNTVPPSQPPAGWTEGTVCQNNICQLAPVPVQPNTKAAASSTPNYNNPYVAPSTFAAPSAAPSGVQSATHVGPNGVSIDVAPTGQNSDLSDLRGDVLRLRH